MTSLPHARKVAPEVPDAELAARAARGDHAAFERIMRRHNRALFRTATSTTPG